MNRHDLERLTKDELVELVLKLQSPPKTSRTSSKPPSTDQKSNRSQSKPGGAKPGHQGHSRRLAQTPDEIQDHRPSECRGCGGAFGADVAGCVVGEYDEIDIPPIRPVVTRHRRMACVCPSCGLRTKAALPETATGSPFGPMVGALIFYCKHQQHFSYQRLRGLFGDVLGLEISEGAIGNLLRREGAKFMAQAEAYLADLRRAAVVASDETGVRIEGVNAQQWVFHSPDTVVHKMAFSRGAQVVRDVMDGSQPDYWISDRYSAQQGHGAQHQTCLAHLARDAALVLERGDERIGLAMRFWMKDAFALADTMKTAAASTIERKARDLDNRLGAIVAANTASETTRKVQRKFANAREQMLTFATAPPGLVEPTNNGSERELRPAVIQRKVTNGFRSMWGAEVDAAFRTVVSTAKRRGIHPLTAINAVLAP
jgi:transposase